MFNAETNHTSVVDGSEGALGASPTAVPEGGFRADNDLLLWRAAECEYRDTFKWKNLWATADVGGRWCVKVAI